MTVNSSITHADASSTLLTFEHVMRVEPFNVAALCKIGRALAELGRVREARKCYKNAVEALLRAARAGDVETTLLSEARIYQGFVTFEETEQHYYRCFSDWKDELANLGKRFRTLLMPNQYDARRIAFILHTGYILGHTEVLFKLLESARMNPGDSPRVRIYVIGAFDGAFVERANQAGLEIVLIKKILGIRPYLERLQWLRENLRHNAFGVCIWVSVPSMAAFALSMRLAPVQIYWALRFHSITGPYIDGYITWGGKGEKTRHYGNQEWEVVPVPFAIDGSLPASSEIEPLRRQFPEKVLLGTLAREEKIDSAPFLQAVASILVANPQAGFLWTGRNALPSITEFFRVAGVAERCHFVGWVDTRLYAATLDVFLETFPHGSGITSYQAFAAGVPLLSYLGSHTIFGTHFWHCIHVPKVNGTVLQRPQLNNSDEYSILCARDVDDYVALAGRLINDAAWRTEVGSRGQAFFREELRNNSVYAERFFATVARFAVAKLGDAKPGNP